jgi:hypothetical protein
MCAEGRRVRDEADRELQDHEADDERERDGRLAAVGVGGDAVGVPVVAASLSWS